MSTGGYKICTCGRTTSGGLICPIHDEGQPMKNEPAFPINFQYANSGLTKLEYFAAMAMHGLIPTKNWDDLEGLVRKSFHIAEAMLKESEKRGK